MPSFALPGGARAAAYTAARKLVAEAVTDVRVFETGVIINTRIFRVPIFTYYNVSLINDSAILIG